MCAQTSVGSGWCTGVCCGFIFLLGLLFYYYYYYYYYYYIFVVVVVNTRLDINVHIYVLDVCPV